MSSENKMNLDETKTLIKSLVVSSSNVHTLESLNSDFKQQIGQGIPFLQFGFYSLLEFLNSMPDILYINRLRDGRLCILPNIKSDDKSQHIAHMVSRQKKKPDNRKVKHTNFHNYVVNPIENSNQYLKSKSNEITKERQSNGTLCREVSKLENTKTSLLDDSKICSICKNNKIKSRDTKEEEEDIELLNSGNFDSESHWDNENTYFGINIQQPSYADIGFVVKKCIFPNDVMSKKLHKIIITHIHNPHRLWFRFKSNDSLYYDTFVIELNIFCNNNFYEKWKFKEKYLSVGVMCCINYKNNWRRAKFLEKNKNEAKLYLVDFGDVIKVNITEIKYLPKKFAEIPFQAFRGSLEGVQPTDEYWSLTSINNFKQMTSAEVVKANIKFIEENTAYILAFNTSKNANNEFFNQMLLEKQIAKRSNNNHLQNKFPTFDMIENSEYPPIAKIRNIIYTKGISYFENELGLLRKFQNLNSADLRELFLHFKNQLINENFNKINENCHVYAKMKCKMSDISKNESYPKDCEIYNYISKWIEEWHKKHGY